MDSTDVTSVSTRFSSSCRASSLYTTYCTCKHLHRKLNEDAQAYTGLKALKLWS